LVREVTQLEVVDPPRTELRDETLQLSLVCIQRRGEVRVRTPRRRLRELRYRYPRRARVLRLVRLPPAAPPRAVVIGAVPDVGQPPQAEVADAVDRVVRLVRVDDGDHRRDGARIMQLRDLIGDLLQSEILIFSPLEL